MINFNNDEFIRVMHDFHAYLYAVYLAECDCNEGALDWKMVEVFFKKLDFSVLYPKTAIKNGVDSNEISS